MNDDDVIKWKHFPRYCPFVRAIHRSPVNSPHKGQWRGALMFSMICASINGWVNNCEACDLRHHRPHYDVTDAKITDVAYLTVIRVLYFSLISWHFHTDSFTIILNVGGWFIFVRRCWLQLCWATLPIKWLHKTTRWLVAAVNHISYELYPVQKRNMTLFIMSLNRTKSTIWTINLRILDKISWYWTE